MAHVKVWLGVALTLGLAAFLWLIPPQLNQQLQQQRPRLEPLLHYDAVQSQITQFFKKNNDTLRQLTTHQGLRAALTELKGKRSARRGKQHRKTYEAIRDSFPFFRGPQQHKRVYIFSHAGQLMFRTDAPDKYESEENLYSRLPFVQLAQESKGKPTLGFWRIGGVPFFFSALPISAGSDVLGVLMMSLKVDRELFVEMGIHPENRKSHPLVLFDLEKPLAMAIPKSLRGETKAWVGQHFHTIARQLQSGLFVSPTPVMLGGKPFSYLVTRVPAPITDSPIGYALLTPLATAQAAPSDIYHGPLSQWAAMGAAGLAFLLALWFSLGAFATRRKLRAAIQQIADAPHQLQLADKLPKDLQPALRTLLNKYQQKQTQAPAPAAPAAAAQAPAPSTPIPAAAPSPKAAATPAPVSPMGYNPLGVGETPAAKAPGLAGIGVGGPGVPSPGAPGMSGNLSGSSPSPGGFKLPPSLLDPAFGGTSSDARQDEASYKPQAPPVQAPQAALDAKDQAPITPIPANNEQIPDLSSELEQAFTSIQEDETPFTEAELGPAASLIPINRKTLNYQQFDGEQMAAAQRSIRAEQHQKIFQEYINVRKKCGESTQGIHYAQFVDRLEKQRATIIQQFDCDDVQFHIYEKKGRAAIKATPIK